MKKWLTDYYKGCAIGVVLAVLMGPVYYGITILSEKITNK